MILRTKLHEKILQLKATSGVSSAEGERLAFLAGSVPAGGVIVEIGSCQARSTSYMAAALHKNSKVLIYSVDLWMLGRGQTPERHNVTSGYRQFWFNLRSLQLSDWVVPIMSDSVKVAKVWELPIDLLFIDGGHQYKEVLADYKGWAHFVKPGGIIVFHDYNHNDIKMMVDEEFHQNDDWKFTGIYERLWVAQRRTK